jgi:Ca2+-binding EF-hand superfamily protein
MITSKIEHSFANFLLILSEAEIIVENERKILSNYCENLNKFDTYSLFKFMDTYDQQFIDEYSLAEFFRKYNFLFTNHEIKFIIKFYDSDEDGKLTYSDILNIILPSTVTEDFINKNSNSSRMKKSELFISPLEEQKHKELIYNQIFRILEGEIILSKKILENSDVLVYSEYIFNKLDRQNKNYLNFEDLRIFLNINEIFPSDIEIKCILNRLDVDKDGRIGKNEFVKILNYSLEDIIDEDGGSFNNKNKILYSPRSSSNSSRNKNFNKNSNTHFLKNSYLNNFYKYSLSNEEIQFLEFIKDLIEIESNYENLKCSLSLKHDFNLDDLFNIWEKEGKEFLTLSELKEGFNTFGIFPSSEETIQLVKKFDSNKNGVLYYEDFLEMFYPINNEFRKLLQKRRIDSEKNNKNIFYKNNYSQNNNYNYSNLFSIETEILLKDYLNALIIGENKVELIRKKIHNTQKDFSIINIFNKIDQGVNKYLTLEDFSYYLKKNNFSFIEKDIALLVNRFDKDRDGRVGFLEFSEEIYPKSRDYY